jgi:hypothetical protein
MIPRDASGVNHHLAINRIERFDNPELREFALGLFAERIGIANRERGWHALRKIERVADLDENLVTEILGSSKVQCGKRIRAVSTVKNENVCAA